MNERTMGILTDATLQQGGEVFGVVTEALAARGLTHCGVTWLVVVGSMHERKETMVARADALVALPGGLGTSDELFEILTPS